MTIGNPTSTGMGQGAAQVFDISGVVSTYARTAMIKNQQRQQDEQMLAKMMTQFDPSKIRAKDIPKFNDMYGRLKSLYSTNKDLYRNPLAHPQAYAEAQSLVNGLRSHIAESRATEDFMSKAGQEAMRNRNLFAPKFKEKMEVWMNSSTDEIKQMTGGRIPDFTDVQYIPEEPKFAEMKTLVESTARSIDGVREDDSYITSKEDPTIPEFGAKRIRQTVIDPSAMPEVAGFVMADPDMRQYYEYTWGEMDQAKKNAIRTEAVSKYPDLDLLKVDGAQMYATMDLLGKYRVLDRKDEYVDDKAMIRDDNERIRKENQKFQRDQQSRSQNFQASQRQATQKWEDDKLNMNLEQTREMLTMLQESGKQQDGSGDAMIETALAPLHQIAAGLESGIQVVKPSNYQSATEFYAAIEEFKGKDENGESKATSMEFFDIDQAKANKMYNNSMPAVVFKTIAQEGEKPKVFMIDPSRKNMDAGIQSIIQIVGSKTTGFAQGYPGFTQPKTTKKK